MLRPSIFGRLSKPSNRSRFVAFAAAGLIEIGLVTALLSGLAARAVKELPQALNVVDVLTPPPPQPAVQPVKPVLVQPQMPTVPIPEIRIQRRAPAHAIAAIAAKAPVATVPMPPVAMSPVAVPEPAQAPPAIAPTVLQAVAGTHTTPPYPEMARRLGQQGQVRVHISVGADGQITRVDVAKSSGSAFLDDAARNWVLSNWRYRAATRDGAGVVSETDAIVVFDLKDLR
ncbi:MAG TPA: TonB family protein [Rhizomicrobium sp.]|jgi:protein TonB